MTFYKDVPEGITDSAGDFEIKYEIENNDEIISVMAKITFKYVLSGMELT